MMNKIPFVFALLLALIISCAKQEKPVPATKTSVDPSPAGTQAVTYRSVDSLGGIDKVDTVVFHARNGMSYTVVSRPVEAADTLPSAAGGGMAHMMAAGKKNKPCDGDQFDGNDRKAAKLSIATAASEDFTDLGGLIATLPTDASMGTTHTPAISTGSTSNRVTEEKRNAHVQTVWIYTFTREADEDYHVIIGTSATRSKAKFMNMEISGLPSSTVSSFAKLQKVRDDFESFFGLHGKCISGYAKDLLDNPVKVEVTGSLFFDKLHFDQKAAIGPAEARSSSYWEIHPVTSITF